MLRVEVGLGGLEKVGCPTDKKNLDFLLSSREASSCHFDLILFQRSQVKKLQYRNVKP